MAQEGTHQRLVDGYPDLERLSTEWYVAEASSDTTQPERIAKVLGYLDRLLDLEARRRFLIVGCGPHPDSVALIARQGFDVIAVEPVESFVREAQEMLGDDARVVRGSAERLPVEDASQDVVFLESVLEHVESPSQALGETYRALAPGGVAFVITTNRLRFSARGENGEFNVPFFNWLPRLVKEGYVYRHLHFDPHLANYTTRPAVHWFTFARLAALGREAGFAQFYSHVDLIPAGAADSGLKRRLLHLARSSPWARAAVLSQVGGVIFMWKREEP